MSIESRRRKRDGRIVYDVRLRDPSGREYSRTFPTKRAAEMYEAKERVDRNRGAWVDPRKADTTLGELAQAWLESNPGKTESCATRDEGIVRNHINPILEARPVGSINRRDVQSLVAGWSRERDPEQSAASSTFCERSSTTRSTAMSSAIPLPRHQAPEAIRRSPEGAHTAQLTDLADALARLLHRWST